jgi:hypothetical protein
MMFTEFEQQIRNLQDRLRALPARSVAVFSAACAERLAVFYEQFTSENSWDCYPAVRKILDLCWEVLLGHDSLRDELKACSAQLLRYVPHGDDFTGILCTGAQDFAACIESAIKWIFLAPNARYGVVYYPLEILYATAALNRPGKPSVDDPDTHINDSYIMNDPAIAREFAAQANDLAILEMNPSLTEHDVGVIRNAAVANRHGLKEK